MKWSFLIALLTISLNNAYAEVHMTKGVRHISHKEWHNVSLPKRYQDPPSPFAINPDSERLPSRGKVLCKDYFFKNVSLTPPHPRY